MVAFLKKSKRIDHQIRRIYLEITMLQIIIRDKKGAAIELSNFQRDVPNCFGQDEYEFADKLCEFLCITDIPQNETADELLVR